MKIALITVYYPSEKVYQNVGEIAKQVDTVFVCDNTPAQNEEREKGFQTFPNVRYVFFGGNLGLSRAFNKILLDSEYPWKNNDYVLFFDQDSSIEREHVNRLICEYESLVQAGRKVGCIGPMYFNTSSGIVEIPKMKTPLNHESYEVASIITSSMLCTYGNLRDIGFWNENIFLDMADWDLCWRLRAAGKLCCLTKVVTLHHSLGHGEKKIGPFRLRMGSAFREYYQLREALYLLFQKYTPLKFRVQFLALLFVRSPLHLLFLDQRGKRFRYMWMGIRDFIRKEHGELPIQK